MKKTEIPNFNKPTYYLTNYVPQFKSIGIIICPKLNDKGIVQNVDTIWYGLHDSIDPQYKYYNIPDPTNISKILSKNALYESVFRSIVESTIRHIMDMISNIDDINIHEKLHYSTNLSIKTCEKLDVLIPLMYIPGGQNKLKLIAGKSHCNPVQESVELISHIDIEPDDYKEHNPFLD